jgi:type IV pilus assembly protein PilW
MFLASARTNTTLTHAAVVAAGYYNCSVNIGSASVSQGSMSCPVAPDPAATQLQYPAQSTLAGVTTVAYFVTDTNELMRLSAGAANAEELLEGVERMVLRYGVDTNNDGVADQYRLAAGLVANDWPNVLTIRMGLIMKSNANVLDVAASVTCAGVNSPVDTELRKCIMSTINIRSRGGQ